MAERKNGWRSGRDPVQRLLRIITALVMLATFVVLSVDPDRGGDRLPTLALALGALLILLGYEGLVWLPGGIGRKDDDEPS